MRLLPRSATGQQISNYLSILTGPRRSEEVDGPEHMFYVLLDAGRSGLIGSEYQDMLRCIRCGACMNHCPVYQKVGGHTYGWVYPGPMGAVLTPNYVGIDKAIDLPQAATFCNQCSVVCPVKIPLPDLMRKLREEQWERGLRPWYEKIGVAVWAFAAKRPELYGLAAKVAVRVLKWMSGHDGRIRSLPIGAGWTSAATSQHLPARRFASCIASAGCNARLRTLGRDTHVARSLPAGRAILAAIDSIRQGIGATSLQQTF